MKRVDVTKIKKRSSYIKNYYNPVTVPGAREETKTGFRIKGFSGADFETWFERMLPNSSTHLVRHPSPKKTKVLRVLDGSGYLITQDENNNTDMQKLWQGMEIVLEGKKTAYRIVAKDVPLDFFVSQSAKYEARLEIVDDQEVVVRPSAADLRPAISDLTVPPSQNRRSKDKNRAAEQLANQRAARAQKQKEQIKDDRFGVLEPVKAPSPFAGEGGVNPRPTGGNFIDEG